jgi:16S rRNA (guanine966-N2)-methyltransferase
MRVIAGSARGTRLSSPSFRGTRPITDRAKEALFSILVPRLPGAQFLDLFAGTGGVGIEALSRGANGATFVELNGLARRDLESNLRKTHLQERASIVQGDVFDYLRRDPVGFDVVWVSPPQWQGLWARALSTLDARPEWVAEDGVVIVHCDPKEVAELPLGNFERYDTRTYSNVALGFYRACG